MRRRSRNTGFFFCACMCLLSWPVISSAQEERFYFEASGGMAVGWWIYSHGSTIKTQENNLGWDETRLSLFVPANAAALFHTHKFKIGIGASYTWFYIDEIRKRGDAPPKTNRDPLSDGSVKLKDLGLLAEYDLVSKHNFLFGPHVQGGIFSIETTYPERNNFGDKFYFETGINLQFRLVRGLWLNLRPQYKDWLIYPKESAVFHEKHRITAFGATLGFRYGW